MFDFENFLSSKFSLSLPVWLLSSNTKVFIRHFSLSLLETLELMYSYQVKHRDYCSSNYSLDNKLIWREYNDNNETIEKDNEIADTDITAAADPDHRGVEPVVTRNPWAKIFTKIFFLNIYHSW